MPDIAEILNICEIQIHYFEMEALFGREIVLVLPEKCLRHYKKNPKLKLRCLKTVRVNYSGPSPKVMALFLICYLDASFPSASARLKMIMVCP